MTPRQTITIAPISYQKPNDIFPVKHSLGYHTWVCEVFSLKHTKISIIPIMSHDIKNIKNLIIPYVIYTGTTLNFLLLLSIHSDWPSWSDPLSHVTSLWDITDLLSDVLERTGTRKVIITSFGSWSEQWFMRLRYKVLHRSSPCAPWGAPWGAPGSVWSLSPRMEVVDQVGGQDRVLEHLEDIHQRQETHTGIICGGEVQWKLWARLLMR